MDKKYRLSALRVQRNVMETEMAEEELAEDDRFQRIQRRIEELKSELPDSAVAR